ncbi:MAG: hypothetical protein ACRD0G_20210 [Acidimicrobiales bacterium]
MPDLDDALERLVNDPAFREALARRPKQALAGYDLSEDDTALLLTHLSGDDDATGRRVEQRQSKAGLAGLLTTLSTGGSGTRTGGGLDPDLASGDATPHDYGALDPDLASGDDSPHDYGGVDPDEASSDDSRPPLP